MKKPLRIGLKVGRLTLKRQRVDNHRIKWECVCDCGKSHVVRQDALLSGATVSCGCWNRTSKITHGQSRSRTYSVWLSMKSRCNNPHAQAYKDYGARGIKVCERWFEFSNFFEDMGHAPAGLELERIDNSGDYCLANCKWASVKEQARNRRSNKLITFQGITLCLSEWAEKLGVTHHLLNKRIRIGYPLEKVLVSGLYSRNGKLISDITP